MFLSTICSDLDSDLIWISNTNISNSIDLNTNNILFYNSYISK